VEQCKLQLGLDADNTSVDWLTEVVHRLSDAYARGTLLSAVSMASLTRTGKVRFEMLNRFTAY
jgi:hypothetical protein